MKARTRRAGTRARRAATALERLVRIMDTLRSPAGCPWDRDQTHQSLRAHIVEETYEVLEAIDHADTKGLTEELGDVLFQCVFHAQIAAESGQFDLADSINAIATKLTRRHPHVFTPGGRPLSAAARGRSSIRTSAAVKEQWEKIKSLERGVAGTKKRVLSGVPQSMPALLRAYEVGRRVASVGFDWSTPTDVVDKIDEEVRELREALTESPARATEELGDLLFSIAQLSRKLGLEPESALRQANDKFTGRFSALEMAFEERGKSVHEASLEEMETLWEDIKQGKGQRAKGRGKGKGQTAKGKRTKKGKGEK